MEKSAPKKMAPAKAKAVNGIRQTLKKKNKEFEGVLKTYNEVCIIGVVGAKGVHRLMLM